MSIPIFQFTPLCISPWGFPGGPVVKDPPANAGDTGGVAVRPLGWEDPRRRKRQLTSVFLTGKSHG